MNTSDWAGQRANDKPIYHQCRFHEKELDKVISLMDLLSKREKMLVNSFLFLSQNISCKWS